MPAPLNVDKEAVRVLVVAVGPREAARRMNLKESTVLAWSDRGGWLDHLREKPQLPESMRPQTPQGHAIVAIKPADALANALADDSKETRISLSRALRKGAKAAEAMDGDDVLLRSQEVKAVVQSAAMVHSWAGTENEGRATVVNVNLIGLRLPDLSPVIDVYSQPCDT